MLRRFDFPFPLDEAAALEIYTEDPGCDTYLLRPLGQVYGGYFANGAAGKLATLARKRGWRELWAAAARISLPEKGFNAELRGELEDGKISVDKQRANLALLAGVSREWNFGPIGFVRRWRRFRGCSG